MEPSRLATIYTTLTGIAKTTIYRTLSVLPQKSTLHVTPQTGKVCMSTLIESGRSQKHSMQAPKGLKSTEKLAAWPIKTLSQWISRAINAVNRSPRARSEILTGFAPITVNHHGEELAGSMMLRENASNVKQSLCAISTQSQRLVADRVQTVYATSDRSRVYDVEVEGVHEFVVSGVLVHNCRYALEPVMKKRRNTLTTKRIF